MLNVIVPSAKRKKAKETFQQDMHEEWELAVENQINQILYLIRTNWSTKYLQWVLNKVLCKIPKFHRISWCGNFLGKHSYCRASGEPPETLRKLCFSTKFLHQEIRWNYGILHSQVTFKYQSSILLWAVSVRIPHKSARLIKMNVFTWSICCTLIGPTFPKWVGNKWVETLCWFLSFWDRMTVFLKNLKDVVLCAI